MIRNIIVAAAALAAGLATITVGHAAPNYSGFTAHVDNPWFPLLAGTQYHYTGVKDGKPSRDVLTVTHQTKTIHGAQCVVVHDRLYLRGRLAERPPTGTARTAGATSGISERTRPSSMLMVA
jgi:hypothetical protein